MPQRHRIQIDDKHPNFYEAGIGDIIQCYVSFGLSPGSSVRSILTFVENGSLTDIGVAVTTDFRLFGAGEMSAFFFVYGDLTGRDELCRIRLMPVIPGQITNEYTLTIKVPPVEP